MLPGIFDQHRHIFMVTCCLLLCVCVSVRACACVCLCDYNKQQQCILHCEVQGFLSFAFDQFAVMGIGLHPDI